MFNQLAVTYWNLIKTLNDTEPTPILFEILNSETPLSQEQYDYLINQEKIKEFIESSELLKQNPEVQVRFISNFPYFNLYTSKEPEFNLESSAIITEFLTSLQSTDATSQETSQIAKSQPVSSQNLAQTFQFPQNSRIEQTNQVQTTSATQQYSTEVNPVQSDLNITEASQKESVQNSVKLSQTIKQASPELTIPVETQFQEENFDPTTELNSDSQNVSYLNSIQTNKRNRQEAEEKRKIQLKNQNISQNNQMQEAEYNQQKSTYSRQRQMASQKSSSRLKKGIAYAILGGSAATLGTSTIIPLFF
jgi:DNA-binding phage protein